MASLSLRDESVRGLAGTYWPSPSKFMASNLRTFFSTSLHPLLPYAILLCIKALEMFIPPSL